MILHERSGGQERRGTSGAITILSACVLSCYHQVKEIKDVKYYVLYWQLITGNKLVIMSCSLRKEWVCDAVVEFEIRTGFDTLTSN